jgi:hypothetical protein
MGDSIKRFHNVKKDDGEAFTLVKRPENRSLELVDVIDRGERRPKTGLTRVEEARRL